MNPFKDKKKNGDGNIGFDRYYALVALFLGSVLTIVFYKTITTVFVGSYYDDIFTNRGSIPYITTFLFFWGVALLLFSWFGLHKEKSTFSEIRKTLEEFRIIDKESAQVAIDKLKIIRQKEHGNIASNRFIRAMRRIRDGIKQISEIAEMLRDQADIDSLVISNKYAAVKFFIWLIPVLGFVGTVLGVSFAISGFSDIIMAGSDFSTIKGNLGGVTNSLGIAFDTTLLALIKTAILMFAYSMLQKQELSFLITMDEFSVDDLTKKVVTDVKREDMSETAQLTDSIDLLTEKITSWDPRFAETLETFFTRLEQQGHEVMSSVTDLVDRGEQIAQQNSQTATAISGSMDRFKDYSGEVEQSVQGLFDQVKETTGQNAQTAITISESMDRFKNYSRETEQSVQEFFAQAKETSGQNAQIATEISQAIQKLATQINEFNSLQSSLQNNIKCITDLEEFNRCLEALSISLNQLPAILTDMKRPREIRLMETILEENR